MKVNVKKCVSLMETYTNGKLDKVQDRIYCRQYGGLDQYRNEIWGEKEEIPLETSSLYLGTTIAFNREDEAKHGKHILESMKEHIDLIGQSRLNLTYRLHAIKTFELPRIDFRMMCGDITQSDLRAFDRWLRGRISGWLHTPGIVVERFLMSWRDGGLTIPSLEERQYTMLVRTILDMFSTSDIQLLKVMRQFEKEEAAAYNCTVIERDPNSDDEGGGFLRWFGPVPDLRSNAPKPTGNIDDDRFQHPGESEVHEVLLKDLSIFPRALKASQELGLAIWMNGSTPCLRHQGFGIDFTSSKISRPAMWITQEVVRRAEFHSFHNSAEWSLAWKEFQNNPSANHWLNWATSRYDDAFLRFAIGARLYTLNTPARNKLTHPDTAPDIPCPMCGQKLNPNLHHILCECKHGGTATMLDRHNRVACAVRKAIEIGNPHVRILDDKTVLSVCPNIEPELKRLRPDLMFESSIQKGKKLQNIMYLVEIATPWSYEDANHSALEVSYRKKVEKYQPVMADIERKRPGFKCIQATIIVSPTGTFYRESQEKFAKVSKLPRGKLPIHKRCIVDVWPQIQFGRKLSSGGSLAANLRFRRNWRLSILEHQAVSNSLIRMKHVPWENRLLKIAQKSMSRSVF
jgi:hypothetical protein